MKADTFDDQALFNAIGLCGVSDPEDIEEVGDILELVVSPRGTLLDALEDVAAARLALVNTELREEGMVPLELAAAILLE